MQERIADELSKQVKKSLKANPNQMFKVIINLREDANLEEVIRTLSKSGLEVVSTIPGPVPIVAGSVAAKDISQLAQESRVKKIEPDGKTFAVS